MSIVNQTILSIATEQQKQVQAMLEILEAAIKTLKATNDSIDRIVAIIKAQENG